MQNGRCGKIAMPVIGCGAFLPRSARNGSGLRYLFLEPELSLLEFLDRSSVRRGPGHFLLQGGFQPGVFGLQRVDVGRCHKAFSYRGCDPPVERLVQARASRELSSKHIASILAKG